MSRQYVGIDLHRRRSVIIRKDANGQLLSKVHIDNDPLALAEGWRPPGPTRRSWSKRRSGGTGQPTSWPTSAPRSTSPTRSATTGATGG